MHFWARLRDHLRTGQPAFVGLVGDNSAHSPGTRGARIFVRPDGSTEGTIGGGVMEGDIIQRALAAIGHETRSSVANSTGPDAISTPKSGETGAEHPENTSKLSKSSKTEIRARYQTLFHRKKGPGDKSGLACAGEQTNIYLLCEPERDLAVIEEVARRIEADEPGSLEIDPRGIRLVDQVRVGRDQPPVSVEINGADWRYREQLLNWKRAAIFGGGHCGLALSRVLHQLGYVVTLFDTRREVFTFVENTFARHKIIVDDFREAGALIKYTDLTHIIVMTREQPADVRALLGVLDATQTAQPTFPYIGVMGSPAKLAQIRKDLVRAGSAPELFDQVRAPIGLKITSNTPEEIAISIAAELLQERKTLFPHAP